MCNVMFFNKFDFVSGSSISSLGNVVKSSKKTCEGENSDSVMQHMKMSNSGI